MATLTGYKRDSESLYIDKDPEATLNYTFDYSNWLASGEQIDTSNWTIDAIASDTDPIVVSGSIVVNGNKKVTMILTGGTSGNIYTVRNTIVTDDGNTERKFFRVVVGQRSF
tara:strand:- start:817 stop:1152 length:336 start_codon:yes stop_codon:yes gene_type:complete